MSTEEIIREYKEKICPRCEHYNNKEYEECNIRINVNQEAACINYKCLDFCKKGESRYG